MEFLEILKVILLGIVEGITEWLPISSTGHILLFDELFPMDCSPAFKEVFLYVIQLGAILAVVILFWNKLFPFGLRKTQTEQGALKTRLTVKKDIFNLWGKVVVACIPAAVVGILLDMPDSPLVIAITLIFYGVAFILVEKWNKHRTFKTQSVAELSYLHAALIGVFQALSFIPGTSRSGITILGALLLGVSRPAGAEFTFYLAIPVMFGASLLKLLKYGFAFSLAEFGYLLIGAFVAFAVSLFVIKFLMDFVRKHDFTLFGWYRIALGVLVISALVLPPLFA
jgi:undecaprenyl-diphosphatase